VLADAVEVFYTNRLRQPGTARPAPDGRKPPALADFVAGLASVAWEAPAISALIKESIGKHGLKMPKLAMPLRVILTGQAQAPSVDALVEMIGRERVVMAPQKTSLKIAKSPLQREGRSL
jgi:glutamyl-tRNA synthetase